MKCRQSTDNDIVYYIVYFVMVLWYTLRMLVGFFRTLIRAVCLLCVICSAKAFDTTASQVVLIDYRTDAVLFAHNADARCAPSSMTKVFALYIIFELLKQNRITMESMMHVSEKAYKMKGSRMFADINTDISVKDLIRGICVSSGNDAAVTLAEGAMGTEQSFVAQMNVLAKKIGCTNTNFVNASGMPSEEHYSSVRDIARIGTAIIRDFPEYYHFFAEKEMLYNKILQPNRNRLIGKIDNFYVDGIKTGYTDDGGYGLLTSAYDDKRRVVLVVNGLRNDRERIEETRKILRWFFNEFEAKTIVKNAQPIDHFPVWMGSKKVPVVTKQDVVLTLKKGIKYSCTIEYNTPIIAPVKKGTAIGNLVIVYGDAKVIVPVFSGENIEKVGFFARAYLNLLYILFGIT